MAHLILRRVLDGGHGGGMDDMPGMPGSDGKLPEGVYNSIKVGGFLLLNLSIPIEMLCNRLCVDGISSALFMGKAVSSVVMHVGRSATEVSLTRAFEFIYSLAKLEIVLISQAGDGSETRGIVGVCLYGAGR